MNAALVIYIAAVGVVTMAFYTVIAKWEQSRQGRAYFLLFLSLTLIATHFVLEAVFGQAPYLTETALLGFVAFSITWNLWTILWKKYGRRIHARIRRRRATR